MPEVSENNVEFLRDRYKQLRSKSTTAGYAEGMREALVELGLITEPELDEVKCYTLDNWTKA